MIYPDYKDLCLVSSPGPIERTIEEDWIDGCWYSNQNQHCYYLAWEHRIKTRLTLEPGWRNRNKAME
eukprot:2494192-Amphidinium_carterae.1